MHRRSFLALIAAAPSLAAVLQACGDDTDVSSTTTAPPGTAPASTVPVEPVTDARSDMPRAAADPSLAEIAAAAINAFGADLHRRLVATDPEANLVFSPASILLALTMTRAGAAGTTATQMDAVLHIDDAGAFYPAANALSASLDQVNQTVDLGGGETADVVLNLANSLWGQSSLAFQPAFLDLLAREFGAGLELVDYRDDPEAARQEINAWVAEHTEGRIPELLPRAAITKATRLTLLNAIYMKAPWLQQFDKELTADAPFTRPDGSTVDVPMMHDTGTMRHAAGGGWEAVELDYAGRELSMLLVLPDADLAAVEGTIISSWPGLEQFASAHVRLSVPRWDIETSASLQDALRELGMPLAFTADADFSGMTMTGEEQLDISNVVHQANITVDEDGTEAAAATAVVMELTSAPADERTLTFDRPFLFAVRETATGAIIFQGRVTDPGATR